MVAKPDDKSFIPLELLIGDREHRRREGLCHNISLKPYLGGRQDRRDRRRRLSERRRGQRPAENPGRAAAPLGADPDRHQPGQAASHDPLALPTDPLPAAAGRGGGRAAGVEGAWWPIRPRPGGWPDTAKGASSGRWNWPIPICGRSATRSIERLSEPVLDSVRLAQTVAAFVDEAGKEASARRARLRQVVGFRRRVLSAAAARPVRHVALGRPGTAGPRRAGDRARARRSRGRRPPGSTAVSTPPPRSTATPTRRR